MSQSASHPAGRAVLEGLHPLSGERPFLFAWPLWVDILPDCRAVFTARGLEIAAPCVNSDVLPGFRQAGRRVYLTATLAVALTSAVLKRAVRR